VALLAHRGGPATEAWLPYAVGRLQLLEGDATSAAKTFRALVRSHPQHRSWFYHAAWAAALIGDHTELAYLLAATADRPEHWAVACVSLTVAPDTSTGTATPATSTWSAKVFTAHLALSQGRPPPALPDDEPDEPVGHRLEWLRAQLGRGFALDDSAGLVGLLASALFRRLPQAEQLLWNGLHAEDGAALLADAAFLYGHGRAAYALAAHHLRHQQPDLARAALDRTGWPSGTAHTLLLAWAEACAGDTADAYDRLRRLAEAGESRARRALPRLDRIRQDRDLSRLADMPDTIDLATCSHLVTRARDTGTVDTVVALLSRVCLRSSDPRRTKALRDLVGALVLPDRLDDLLLGRAQWDRIKALGVGALPETERLARARPGNAALALAGAEVALRFGEPLTALRFLTRVQGNARMRGDDAGRRAVEALTAALAGADSPVTAEESPVLRLLDAARLADTAPERCLELLSGDWARHDLARVVDLRPSLGWWCTRVGRIRKVPASLVAAVRSLATPRFRRWTDPPGPLRYRDPRP
jgi:hypothetical protein